MATLEPTVRPRVTKRIQLGRGSAGKPIELRVNAMDAQVKPGAFLNILHYDVNIEPEGDKLPKDFARRMINYLRGFPNVKGPERPFRTTDDNKPASVVYDGRKQAFSPHPLFDNAAAADIGDYVLFGEGESFSEAPPDGAKKKAYRIKIRRVAELDLKALYGAINPPADGRNAAQPTVTIAGEKGIETLISALNVALKSDLFASHPNKGSAFYPIGYDKHDPRSVEQARRQRSVGKGVELWKGYFISLRPATGKMILNVDLSFCPMIPGGNLADVCKAILELRDISGLDIQQIARSNKLPMLNRMLRGVRVSANVERLNQGMTKRYFKIRDVLPQSALQYTFQDNDREQKYNVATYFKQERGTQLRNPHWPVVQVGRDAVYPLELLSVEFGTKYTRKLDPAQTANMIKQTAVKPQERFRGVKEITTLFPDMRERLRPWGIDISNEFVKVQGRVLAAPRITVKDKRGQPVPAQIRDGVWDLGRQNAQFYKPAAPLISWGVAIFANERYAQITKVQNAMLALMQVLSQRGIQIKNDRPKIKYADQDLLTQTPRQQQLSEFLHRFGSELYQDTKVPPQLFICILDGQITWHYPAVKVFGDTQKPVATQCLRADKSLSDRRGYFDNVALKINAKLGGAHSDYAPAIKGISEGLMVCGADVYHPPPGSLQPSISGAVGSLDNSQYASAYAIQPSRVEYLEDLTSLIEQLLQKRHAKTGKYPSRLVVFRDGVSESQYDMALLKEVSQIREACRKVNPTVQPKITYIIASKRHHIRFEPVSLGMADRSGNAPPGTVVDNAITHPTDADFYLQSHAGLQGTSRSTHYQLLLDENGFDANSIQEFTYGLSHAFARCTRSISIASPARYAHLVCERARVLNSRPGDGDTESTWSGSEGSDVQRRRLEKELRERAVFVNDNQSVRLSFV
ncbi:uncharacterized protein L969DRAFT_49503 [Mixia osmundae IAM 14324]|uniref:Piwi domain-containing protein n=1 Tax=Mixia osmundae (strain CBS 9802 / IAM 14324 / JCM 22182 / KY 12970) TaxID=764103 RepID=G7DVX0_MIXOS|nr:uncharacterized protein L969DRAFT_49503 [Mixia osmundae IAM 14324]KEI39588.1 hypothetical protein L969DRAFT_49503 [Mixia osmundae IAM 14324]GAA94730.1 hypothetical protein E5Q_01384 [Mixia osmundae IAM 14324]